VLLSSDRSVHYRSPWLCEHPYRVSKHVTVRCRRRDCRGCGKWWAADQREKLRRNLGSVEGHQAIVTVTAPGQDVLPWDGERCFAGPLRRWNAAAPAGWRDLHRAAAKAAQRVAREHDVWWGVLAQVWQEQRRGALHRHVVVPMASSGQRAASIAYVNALHGLARRHGFGFVDRKLELRSPERCAGYIARYVASELAMCRQLPGHVVEVSRRLTGRTRCTVRTLRAERADWTRRRGARLDSGAPEDLQLRMVDVRARAAPRRVRQSSRRRVARSDDSDDWGNTMTQAELTAVWGPLLVRG
jgi:hypothetical protein